MSKTDEIIMFFSEKIRDCKKCPIKMECNECDMELNCDEMAQKVIRELSE